MEKRLEKKEIGELRLLRPFQLSKDFSGNKEFKINPDWASQRRVDK